MHWNVLDQCTHQIQILIREICSIRFPSDEENDLFSETIKNLNQRCYILIPLQTILIKDPFPIFMSSSNINKYTPLVAQFLALHTPLASSIYLFVFTVNFVLLFLHKGQGNNQNDEVGKDCNHEQYYLQLFVSYKISFLFNVKQTRIH